MLRRGREAIVSNRHPRGPEAREGVTTRVRPPYNVLTFLIDDENIAATATTNNGPKP